MKPRNQKLGRWTLTPCGTQSHHTKSYRLRVTGIAPSIRIERTQFYWYITYGLPFHPDDEAAYIDMLEATKLMERLRAVYKVQRVRCPKIRAYGNDWFGYWNKCDEQAAIALIETLTQQHSDSMHVTSERDQEHQVRSRCVSRRPRALGIPGRG